MAEEQKYKIIERLDAGGMAEVFVADSETIKGFKKRLVIKRILPHLTKNEKFVTMFLDEAKLGLQLVHANIVSTFDIGKADQTYFLVMEYVEGTNLKKVIESCRRGARRIPMEQAVYLAREVAEGLSYAHELRDVETGHPLGIVHRDVSPPNILMSKRGEVKLADFGLAKAADQVSETDPGVVKGKFSYLAPETALGQPVDARADIFAVGILLWEMLAGQRLFYGENDFHTVELVREAQIPSICQIDPSIPQKLEDLLAVALARDPARRFQEAAQLAEELTKFLFANGVPVTRSDIAGLVTYTRAEQAKSEPVAPRQPTAIIDALIQEEVFKFSSLEDWEDGGDTGAMPLSYGEIGGRPADDYAGLDPGAFEDTRDWSGSLSDSGQVPRLQSGELAAIEDMEVADRPTTDKHGALTDSGNQVAMGSGEHPAFGTGERPAAGTGEQSVFGTGEHANRNLPAATHEQAKIPGLVWALLGVAVVATIVAILLVTKVI